MKKRSKVLPISLAIAALLEGSGTTSVKADSPSVGGDIRMPSDKVDTIRVSQLWGRKNFIDRWTTVEGHRSHYSHRSSRGSSHGNSWHGNSHSSSHRSHYSSRGSSSGSDGYSSGSNSNIVRRAAWRVIWRDDDDNDGIDGLPDKTRRTTTTTTTTTIPTAVENQVVQQPWSYETCWFDDGDLGAPIVLQVRSANGEWQTVKSPSARTVLKRYEQVENSKCTAERPHSAVTTWLPSGPGIFFLRHYYVGFKKIEGYPYEEIVMLNVS